MSFNVVIGCLMVVYGVFMLLIRTFSPQRSWKLELMQKKWGEKTGNRIHFISYIVFPIALGVFLYARS